jgi:putative NIF3 family GTP cyclohydrolase 1 type 2
MRRIVSWALIVACAAVHALGAIQDTASTPESGVAAGARQVEEGDFEAAVATLESAIPRLRGDPARVRLLVQADIQLAVAHTALDHTAQAVQAFAEALSLDPSLHLDAARFSPKVLRALETAREQAMRRRGSPARKSSSGRKAALIGGGVVVAAGATVLAVRGGGTSAPTFSGARFGTPARECPNGSDNVQLPFTILVEASNPSGDPVPINSVTTVVTIEVSPSFPGEIGFPSSQPSTVVPSSVPAKQNVTLQISSYLICGNGEGDPGRFNEWSGRVTLTTSAGVVMLNVADRMRVSIP